MTMVDAGRLFLGAFRSGLFLGAFRSSACTPAAAAADRRT